MSNDTTNMIDEDAIIWEELTSDKGKKFRIGYLKEEGIVDDKKQVTSNGKEDFGIALNWPDTASSWTNTESAVNEKAAISKYKLYRRYGYMYDYRLEFNNHEHYNYVFYDETGDSYRCNTFRNGDHFIDYDSDKPRIVFVRGS